MKIINQIKNTLVYPFALTVITAKSEVQRIKSFGKNPVIQFQAEYQDQPILLMALYQKGRLRPDCLRLLEAAKRAGCYVVAVNTLKLRDPDQLRDCVDCYIEKFNFGRDFSSYQTGFLHIFDQRWHRNCPRVLMLNDSIFFARDKVDSFLSDMISADTEVLGSTENYEIEYHLGSFCISIGNYVLNSEKFQTYWRKYRLSDVRPMVIYRGEMQLSKTLKRCVSEANQFKALYSSTRFFAEVAEDQNLMDFALRNGRTSDLTDWKRTSVAEIAKFMEGRFIFRNNSVPADASIRTDFETVNESDVLIGYYDVERYVSRNLKEGTVIPEKTLDSAVVSMLTEVFMDGSQIHQNAAVLLHIGLPIIKLDGLYRGMFNIFDVNTIMKTLVPEDAAEFQNLIMERPYGGRVLRGWKAAAFMRGLI